MSMTEFHNEGSSSILMDPVHGGIGIAKSEWWIIDHPLFQRLRHIRQNDLLEFVFPGAKHSRFEHSIGVMHMAGRVFRNMTKGYREEMEIEDESKFSQSYVYLYKCLRYAALLHDVGHLPFSHQFEMSDSVKSVMSNIDLIDYCWSSGVLDKKPERLTHEEISVVLAKQIVDDLSHAGNMLSVELCDIISILEAGRVGLSGRFIACATQFVKGIKDHYEVNMSDEQLADNVAGVLRCIVSGEVDADKMDYLLRDSYYTGCSYGKYNVDHLINNMLLGWHVKNGKLEWLGIALRMKAMGALEEFVFSRYNMYLQVYNHKTAVGFKWILGEALKEIMEDEEYNTVITGMLAKLENMVGFSDTMMWEMFRGYTKKWDNSWCEALLTREKLLHVYSVRNGADFEVDSVHELLLESGKYECVVTCEASSKFSKISPKFDQIRVLVPDKVWDKTRLKSIFSCSKFFSKFEDDRVIHFYAP